MAKLPNEIEYANKLFYAIEKFRESQDEGPKILKQKTFQKQFNVKLKNQENWGESALQRVIRERRKIPKAERMAMKEDSIDEIDTTDLEDWTFKGRRFRELPKEGEEQPYSSKYLESMIFDNSEESGKSSDESADSSENSEESESESEAESENDALEMDE